MRASPHHPQGIEAPPRPAVDRDRELAALVKRASDGDALAWERLYARFTPLLRGIARSYRLAASDVEDAVQTAWLRLLDNRAVVRRALATLPERQRELMALLAADASMDYCAVGAALAMPVGSIGPTRARSLARVRAHLALHDYRPSGR